MTLLSVVLLGAGLILVASALDNSSIVDTFHKIVSGQPIDWTGGSGSGTPVTGAPAVVGKGGLINPNSDGSCPSGYTSVTVSGGKLMCQAQTP